MASLLRLANISKTYSITKTQKQDVLKGVTATFEHGEFVALLGESGCGKSTLINILGGLDSEYTGSVIVKGKFTRDFTPKQMDDYRKKRVGLIFQNYQLISHMSVIENVEIAMQMTDINPTVRRKRAHDLLKLVGLDAYSEKQPSQLSGGQEQRVAIARALANNPSIILADEPTGALDKQSQEQILTILRKIVEAGKLVIIVTHSALVASHCNRVVKLDDGTIVSDETKYKIKKRGQFEKTIMPKPIRTKELSKLSYRNLIQTKSRSLLVSVGMSIGIAAMIVILALGQGLTHYVQTVYADNLQSTQVTVYRSDYDEISDTRIETIDDISGTKSIIESTYLEDITYVYEDLDDTISGLSAYYSSFYPAMVYGAMGDENTIIINETLASTLTDQSIISVIGTTIQLTIDDVYHTYTITGIYDDASSDNDEAHALMDDTNLTALIDTNDLDTNMLYITLTDVTYVNTVLDDLETLGYQTYQDDSSAQQVITYIEIGTKVLTGVGMISMVVASLMIFIVLYISIVERTKEIGILRAIGAQKKDIRRMFIFEAAMLGLAGGTIGVFISILITVLTNSITGISLETNLISYNVLYYLFGLLLSVLVSLLAGIAPSLKAADLDPVESLRFE